MRAPRRSGFGYNNAAHKHLRKSRCKAKLSAEELFDGPVRFANGIAMIARTSEVRIGKRDPSMWTTVVPEAGSNTLIVTHKPNILDAFG
jgi:hypothetical protein